MAITADSVVVELEARTSQYNARIRESERIFDRSMRNIGGAATGMERAVGGTFSRLGPLFAGVSAVAGARAYLGLADSFKNLQAQLRLATAESGNFQVAQEDVSRIARETRTGIEETAQLYGAFARNAQQLGITQEQAARSTETISKAFQISGATSAEAAGGLRQFLQALQSGVLRGEEFNSVVENAPRLAKLLADQLSGGNVGALRKLAEQGKITAQELTDAITNVRATEAIDKEFRQLPVTFDQSMTLVKNAAIETFGAFDRGGQFSQSLANFFQDGAEGFAGMANDAENAGAQIRVAFETLQDMFDPIVSAAARAFSAVQLNGESTASRLRTEFVSLLDRYDTITRTIGNLTGVEGVPQFGQNFRQRSEFERNRTETLQFARSVASGLARQNPRAAASPRAIAASTSAADVKKAQAAAKRAAAEAERARLEEQRNTDRYNDDLYRLERDELRGKATLTQNAGERAEIEKQLIALDQREYEEGIKRRLRDGEFGLNAELAQQRANRLLLGSRFNAALEADVIAQEEASRQRALEIDGLRDQEETIRSAIELTDSRVERLEIERRLLALAEQQERLALDEAIARGEIADAAQARANLETRQSNRRAGVERSGASPLERYSQEVGAFSANINDEFERVQVDGLKSLEDGITGVIDGTRSLGDAFRDVSNQIISDLVRIAVRKAIIEPLLGSLFGGGGANLGSLLPGRASGGNVVKGKPYMTGENGRELFVPGQSGKIYSTGALNAAASRGGGGTVVQQSFVLDARGGVVTQDLLRQVNALASQKAVQSGRAAYEAAPSRFARQETLGT